MEPEGSLPLSQEPAACPYPQPARSVHTPQPTSWRPILILSSHLRLGLPSGLFPSALHIKSLYTPLLSPIRAACPAHLIYYNGMYNINTSHKYSVKIIKYILAAINTIIWTLWLCDADTFLVRTQWYVLVDSECGYVCRDIKTWHFRCRWVKPLWRELMCSV